MRTAPLVGQGARSCREGELEGRTAVKTRWARSRSSRPLQALLRLLSGRSAPLRQAERAAQIGQSRRKQPTHHHLTLIPPCLPCPPSPSPSPPFPLSSSSLPPPRGSQLPKLFKSILLPPNLASTNSCLPPSGSQDFPHLKALPSSPVPIHPSIPQRQPLAFAASLTHSPARTPTFANIQDKHGKVKTRPSPPSTTSSSAAPVPIPSEGSWAPWHEYPLVWGKDGWIGTVGVGWASRLPHCSPLSEGKAQHRQMGRAHPFPPPSSPRSRPAWAPNHEGGVSCGWRGYARRGVR